MDIFTRISVTLVFITTTGLSLQIIRCIMLPLAASSRPFIRILANIASVAIVVANFAVPTLIIMLMNSYDAI